MEPAVYAVEAEIEAHHWWFVGRRRLFARELARAGIAPRSRVLDIGTSTGTNLRMLRELGFESVMGLDPSAEAIRYVEAKGFGPVKQGDVRAMPFADESFDLVLATDIIEHVEDDRLALREIARVLAPNGKALITVPAFRSLWGLQDDVSHHKRRYRRRELLRVIQAADLHPSQSYYFNYILFVPIWAARRVIDLCGIKLESENQANTPLVNRVLSVVFGLDIRTAPLLRPPFGVSLLVLAERRDQAAARSPAH